MLLKRVKIFAAIPDRARGNATRPARPRIPECKCAYLWMKSATNAANRGNNEIEHPDTVNPLSYRNCHAKNCVRIASFGAGGFPDRAKSVYVLPACIKFCANHTPPYHSSDSRALSESLDTVNSTHPFSHRATSSDPDRISLIVVVMSEYFFPDWR